jgi:hypothetical protein
LGSSFKYRAGKLRKSSCFANDCTCMSVI